MMSICSGCGKIIDSKFRYCPWCGYSRIEQDKEDAAELRLRKYEEEQRENQYNEIVRLENQLNSLEKELSILVLSAEMHK